MAGREMNESELFEALKRWEIKISKPSILVDGIIKEVDETKANCTVTVNKTDFFNIPLKVLLNSKASILEIPKVGTACTMRFKNNNINCPQLVDVHEDSKFLVTIGASTLEVTDGLWKFNGGTLDGIPKAQSLVDQINRLENLVNGWIIKYNAHTHGYAPNEQQQTTNIPAITTLNDIQNTKIKQ